MVELIAGLLVFLGVHSVRIVADPWRTRMRARLGPLGWKALYSAVSVLGLWLIVMGYGVVRQSPVQLWSPPYGMRHLAALLTLLAFVLVAAAYVPGNQIKARLHHPMVMGVGLWALAHLLSNGQLGHALLFGSFAVWALLDGLAAQQRDRRLGTRYRAGSLGGTLLTVALGAGAWVVFAFWLHGSWIGVRPLG